MTKCSVFNEKRNFKTVEYKYGEFNYTIVSTIVKKNGRLFFYCQNK